MVKLTKKSQGITLNTVIIAVLGILVLVVLAIIFGGKLLNFGQKTTEIESSAGSVDQASCKLQCASFNNICIGSYSKGTITYYYVKQNDYCVNLINTLQQCAKNGFVSLPSDIKNHEAINQDDAINNNKGVNNIESVSCS